MRVRCAMGLAAVLRIFSKKKGQGAPVALRASHLGDGRSAGFGGPGGFGLKRKQFRFRGVVR